MGKLMGLFNITNRRSDDTVTPPPSNSFLISSLFASRCTHPPLHQFPDTRVYYDSGGVDRDVQIGDIVYADQALTIPYNTSGENKDYSVNGNKIFISLDANSKYINQFCR